MGLRPEGAYNNFHERLAYSLKDEEQINQIYFKKFRNVTKVESVVDLGLQALGIDKIVYLTSGHKISIEEKKRTKGYTDVLFEEYSCFEKKTPGWIEKDLFPHYLCYIIMPKQTAYLFPFHLLQTAYLNNKEIWLGTYNRMFAQNKTYKTSNIAVPLEAVLRALHQEMITGF